MERLTRFVTSLALGCAALTLPQSATACRLALALGFDVSRSVDAADYRTQTDGILAALYDGEVRELILEQPSGHVALSVFEWSGTREHHLIVDWTVLDSASAIDDVALRLLTHERRFNGLTAVGEAIDYGRDLIGRAPECMWQTLDIAGDGQTNEGTDPVEIYAEQDFYGLIVNSLAIGGHESEIRGWFERNVTFGPGAFTEYTPEHESFAQAFRRKLLRELQEPTLGAIDTPGAVQSG